MSNSPLVRYRRLSPNRNTPRNHKIDTVTIHCVVGQCTVEALGRVFAAPSRQASSNYGIGRDGKIGMYVEEKDRSWCSSSASNDHRAVTIEVASDTKPPYAVTDAAYAALLDLVTDICRRNGIARLVWSDNEADRVQHRGGCNMTVHRDFAATACPGEYLFSRQRAIADAVNRRLTASPEPSVPAAVTPYRVRVRVPDLRIRRGPGTDCASLGFVRPGVYTIVAEAAGPGAARWGRLKSGAGWIALDFVSKC